VEFEDIQQPHDGDPNLGFYIVPAAYLGYRPDEAPAVLLHQIDMPASLLFEMKSLNDLDTLTWREAMSESAKNVTKWLAAADKEIKATRSRSWIQT
jgi:hypothetical protein